MKETLTEWLTYMQGIHVSAIDMGLSRVLPVAEKLDIVEQAKNAYVFTVAGTNGKGSTTAVIAEITKQAGYKTGLYQSPELLDFNERVRIDGVQATDKQLVNAFEKVEQARLACGLSLSFFEMTTLAAFLIFAEAKCDVWVLEVGLGGRLDVVNIIDPDVAVITNVSIDHVDWLGDSREKIAYEKAGILRNDIPLVYGEADMPEIVQQKILELNVNCYQHFTDFAYTQIQDDGFWQYSNAAITIQLPQPSLSLINCANAITAVIASSLSIKQSGIQTALTQVKLSGRFDYQQLAERRWLFDVAHNEQGVNFLIEQFKQSVNDLLPDGRLVLLFSMLSNKDINKVVDLLDNSDLPIAHWQVAKIDHHRAAELSQLQQVIDKKIIDVPVNYYDNFAEATDTVIKQTTKQDLILVCGSFHSISECIKALKNR